MLSIRNYSIIVSSKKVLFPISQKMPTMQNSAFVPNVASTESLKYKYKYKYLGLKYKYKYKYLSFKYKYKYKYFKSVLKYYSSTSTSTKYYIPGQ